MSADSWDDKNMKLKVGDLSQLATNSPHQTVDVDNLEVELLIVCKNPAAFQQSASFLSRRGWPTTVVGSLAKAIEFITKSKPDFVLVSFNHPNQQVAKLPVILAQTFNLESVGFVEFADAQSTARLAASPLANKIQGLPSGPNIQRTIRKILIDRYAPTSTTGESSDQERASQNDLGLKKEQQSSADGNQAGPIIQSKIESKSKGVVHLKGPESAHDTDSMSAPRAVVDPQDHDDEAIEGGSYRMGRKKPRARLKDINSSASSNDEDLEKKSKKLLEMLEKSPSRGESGMIFLPSKADPEAPDDGIEETDHESGSSKQHTALQTGAIPEKFKAYQNGPMADKNPQIHQEGDVTKGYQATQTSGPSREMSASMDAAIQGKDILQSGERSSPHKGPHQQSNRNQASDGHASSGGLLPKAPHLIMPERRVVNLNRASGPGVNKSEGLIAKMLEDSLNRVCAGEIESIALDQVETVGVIPFESTDLTGYIIVSIPRGLQDQALSFLKGFQSSLESGAPKGLPLKSDNTFLITTESYNFKEWMAAEATQSFLAYHEGYEVGVALLQVGGSLPNPKVAEKNMATIALESISPDLPVNFKAYLHLKENNKYFLYLRNGRKLYKNQKEKLLKNKREDLYIKDVDVGNFKTYAAASAIQSSTKKYRTPKGSEAA